MKRSKITPAKLGFDPHLILYAATKTFLQEFVKNQGLEEDIGVKVMSQESMLTVTVLAKQTYTAIAFKTHQLDLIEQLTSLYLNRGIIENQTVNLKIKTR